MSVDLSTEKEVNDVVKLLKNSTMCVLEELLTSTEIKDKIVAIEQSYLSFHKDIHSEIKAELSASVQEQVSSSRLMVNGII